MAAPAPDNFCCPITLEPMQVPYLCPHCSKNFERAAIVQALAANPSCPHCRNALAQGELVYNRVLRDQIQEWLAGGAQGREGGAVLVDAQAPLVAVFVGKMGVGKSKSINTIAGRRVAESRQSAVGVTAVPEVVFDEALPMADGTQRQVMLVDAPGLFDPNKSNEETLVQLTHMLHIGVAGVDVIVHVVRMGRLDEDEVAMPMTILEGLATTPGERARLAKRYRILVTHCDSSDDHPEVQTLDEAIVGFRAVMGHVFPAELRQAVDEAFFTENDMRLRSDYNNPERLRTWLVRELLRCRENRAVCYKPQLLSDVLDEARARLNAAFAEHLSEDSLITCSHEDILAIQRFFQHVEQTGCWQPPRGADRLPAEFVGPWSALGLVVRDRVARELAVAAADGLAGAARAAMEREYQQRRAAEQEEQDRQWRERVAGGNVPIHKACHVMSVGQLGLRLHGMIFPMSL